MYVLILHVAQRPVDCLITLVHSFLFFPFFSLNHSFTSLVPAEVSDQNFVDEDRVEKSLSGGKKVEDGYS